MRRHVCVLFFTLVWVSADTCLGALILSGGGLTLAEQGGSFAPGNLAQGAAPFALDELDYGIHFISNLNNGTYGNSSSWIGGGATGTSGPFAGISLGAVATTVRSIAFGRSNLNEYGDRWSGLYTLEYTTVPNPSAATPDADWTAIGTLNYVSAGGSGFDVPWLRHRYNFSPVVATGIRLKVPSTGVGDGTAIDEIELYATPGDITIPPPPPPVRITPASGFTISWNGNEGKFRDPLAPPDQAGAPNNAALAANGALAFGSSAYPNPAHTIAHANDGYYGNSNSWLSDPGDAAPFVGIDLVGSAPLPITSVAFGRDNGNDQTDPGPGGVLMDRWQGLYTLQYTLLPDPGALTPVTGDATTGWTTVGTIELVRQGDIGEDLVAPWLRHEFDVSREGGPLMATGIRILAPYQNCIDEVEINVVPEPSTLALLGTAGIVLGLVLRRRRFGAP